MLIFDCGYTLLSQHGKLKLRNHKSTIEGDIRTAYKEGKRYFVMNVLNKAEENLYE